MKSAHPPAPPAAQSAGHELGVIFAAMSEAVVVYDAAGLPVRANPAAVKLLGFDPVGPDPGRLPRALGLKFATGKPVKELPPRRALRGEVIRDLELTATRPEGAHLQLVLNTAPIKDAQGQVRGTVAFFREAAGRRPAETGLRGSMLDLEQSPAEVVDMLQFLEQSHDELELRVQERTAELETAVKQLEAEVVSRKQAEQHIHGTALLLELFTIKTRRQEYLEAVVRLLRDWSGCQCAGIRVLDEAGGLPFAAQVGFNPEFVLQENQLRLAADPCACLRVLQGRPRREDAPWMNVRGSFFCNQMDQRQPACASAGPGAPSPCAQARYTSMAHVPIRYRDQVIGAVQLGDRRLDKFNAGTVEFIEAVSPLIGEALHRFKVEGQLRESEQHFRSMFERHEAIMLLVAPDSGAIVGANPAAERFYGYARAQLCAMKFQDLEAPPPGAAAGRRPGMREPRNFFVVPHQVASGETRTVEVHSSPITESGRRLLFLIIHDITERKRLEKQILDISDQERKRVGQDLHDSLGGNLTGLALLSKALAQVLREQQVPQAEIAEEVVAGINHAVVQTRSIARGLCPVELGAFGLASGLQELAGTIEKLFQISCQFQATGEIRVFDELTATHLFRIAQEAVTNAARHGQARQVRIRLAQRKQALLLQVRDDGLGLPQDLAHNAGMGLRTMRYRAEVIGAHLTLKSEPGKGTLVACLVPTRAAGLK
jgi:PAS domain S-box-containing protein